MRATTLRAQAVLLFTAVTLLTSTTAGAGAGISGSAVGLDDTVEKWLPGFVRGNGNDGRKITVRQLLQHAAGIYDGNFPTIDNPAQLFDGRLIGR